MRPNDLHNDHPDFQIPDGYFEQFQEQLEVQMALEKVLGGKITSGFKVPDGYFEDFKVNVSTRLAHDTLLQERKLHPQQSTQKVIPIFRKQSLWTAAAVAAVVMIAVSILPWSTEDDTSFDSLEITEIEAYVKDQDLALSDYELGALLSEEAFESLENGAAPDDAALIEYLENNTEDTSFFLD